ncbi:BZIP transcription factor [Quillaja saponaria]|uniref:BZIP transcription factor n=1 Tax=Quillaja saponaria TaxID=32244 RepID=A0AAD7Q870_QUISA|nr:BZIP transcription factor [Quillaja saponaria]
MADPLVVQPPLQPSQSQSLHDLSAEFDNLPIPSMDSLFFSDNNDAMQSDTFASDLGSVLGLDENVDLQINFDDLDDLYFPSETDEFLIPDGENPTTGSFELPGDHPDDRGVFNSKVSGSVSPESGSSAVSGNQSSGVSRFLNLQPSESGSCKREYSPPVTSDNSCDRNLNDSNGNRVSSPDSCGCDQESSEPFSSQGSGNGGSGVYEVLNSPSPDSGHDDLAISFNVTVDQNVKLEEDGKNSVLKRKKDHDEGNTESRTPKYRRSSMPAENANQQCSPNAMNEDDEKRKARLMRNRESAQLSRQRKKHYVDELEDKVRAMHSTISELNNKISFVMAENASLRHQLGGGGMCPPSASGMFPHPPVAPMAYPWMPCAPYVVKSQGSQVPLVPIPRLKPQQPVSASKVKKSESKKNDGKTKKFRGIGSDASGRSTYVSDRFYSQQPGRILHVNGHLNGSQGDKQVEFSNAKFGVFDQIKYERGGIRGEQLKYEQIRQGSQPVRCSDESIHLDNASEPLVASLYVPRNDKLVKIDGNLIIHSVLASEKAMASQAAREKKDNRKTGLAVARDRVSALAIPEVGRNRGGHPHLYRNRAERHKALASSSTERLKDRMKSTATDGKLQQWFREGLAGPMLSSGMCTEVFQFDVSPTAGAIVPASSVANVTAENHRNGTNVNKGRNRRILHGLPVSVTGSPLNTTEDRARRISQNNNFHGNKSVSSMVVSVLADPREAW